MKKIILIIYCFTLWMGLTWTASIQTIIAGAFVSILVGLIFGDLFITSTAKLLQPRRWMWFFLYMPVFFWEMTKANFDVAYRVLHPKMPIHPGIVKVKTRIKSDMGKTFLANSITLTPGTFTVDMKDEFLYIHWINVRHKDVENATKDIVSRFEKYLIKVFD